MKRPKVALDRLRRLATPSFVATNIDFRDAKAIGDYVENLEERVAASERVVRDLALAEAEKALAGWAGR